MDYSNSSNHSTSYPGGALSGCEEIETRKKIKKIKMTFGNFTADRFSNDVIDYLLTFLDVKYVQNLGQVNHNWANKIYFEKIEHKWTQNPSPLALAAQIRNIVFPRNPTRSLTIKIKDCLTLAKIEKIFSVNILTFLHIHHLEAYSHQDLTVLQRIPNLQSLCTYQFDDRNLLYIKNNIKHLDLCMSYITDNGLASLSRITQLQKLNISYSNITDIGLLNLRKFAELQELRLNYLGRITDAGFLNLRCITNLRKLALFDNQITDNGLFNLIHLKWRLQELELWIPHAKGITNEGLLNLSQLTELTHLDINMQNITDVGISYLARIIKLEFLTIGDYCTLITESSFKHLKRLKNLRKARFCCSQITYVMSDRLHDQIMMRQIMDCSSSDDEE